MKPLLKAYLEYLICLVIVIIISVVVNVFWGKFVKFDLDTLLWFTSTLAQTFGALIAIVVAVALHHRAVTLAWLGRYKKIKSDDINTFLEKEAKTFSSIFLPLASMANIIIFSLGFLAVINSSIVWFETQLSLIFIFLFVYSFFALMLLLFRVGQTFFG